MSQIYINLGNGMKGAFQMKRKAFAIIFKKLSVNMDTLQY